MGLNSVSAGRMVVAIAVAVASLALVGSAGAKRATIGPKDLFPPSGGAAVCGAPTCTMTTGALPGGKLEAPFRGKITRWKVRVGEPHDTFTNEGPVRLQVLERTTDAPDFLNDEYVAIRETKDKVVEPGSVNIFKTKLKIEKGQFIGLANVENTEIGQGSDPAAFYLRFDDVLVPGAAAMQPDAGFSGSYWLFNARIER
jgi:hypothetical protein